MSPHALVADPRHWGDMNRTGTSVGRTATAS